MAMSRREAILEISSLYRESVITNLDSLLQAELSKPISKDQQEKRDALIDSCLRSLESMKSNLHLFIKNLESKGEIVQRYCDNLLNDYNAIIAAFESLEKIHEFPHDSPLIVAPFRLLGLCIGTIGNLFVNQSDLSGDESTNESIFSMDMSDVSSDSKYFGSSDSSDSSDSPALSTPQRPEGSSKKEKAEVYTPFSSSGTISESSSSKIELPKSALSAQRQNSASPKEENPQDAISLLSEMLRQAKYLRDAIWLLCCVYQSFHPIVEDEHHKGKHHKGEHHKGEHHEDEHHEDEHHKGEHHEGEHHEDEHYKVVKSKLDEFSSIICNLEMNLKIRTAGHIRNERDCYNYKEALKSIVIEMKNIIQNPELKKEMDFIHNFIRSKPVNHNTELKHRENEIYYTVYLNRKEAFYSLCTKIGEADGMVRKDIERIREEIKRKIIVDDVFACIFAVELEMESTSLHPTPSCSEIEESSSQLPSPPETTSDEKKQEENLAGAYSDSITPLPIIRQNLSPITFFKELPKEEVDFRSEFKIIEPSQPPEQIPANHQEEQKDTVNSNQNASGQNGLIYRSLFSRK